MERNNKNPSQSHAAELVRVLGQGAFDREAERLARLELARVRRELARAIAHGTITPEGRVLVEREIDEAAYRYACAMNYRGAERALEAEAAR